MMRSTSSEFPGIPLAESGAGEYSSRRVSPGTVRKVLVVDDEAGARTALATLLEDDGYNVRTAPDGFKALGVLKNWDADVLLTDLRMPVMDGLTLMRKVNELRPDMPCLVMTAFGSVENAVEAMRIGAEDYLTKPLNFDAVEIVLERVFQRLAMARELRDLRAVAPNRTGTRMLGHTPAMQGLEKLIDQVADSRSTVLVTGESGTGKELVARLLHENSRRSRRPFVRLHCAALSESLLESELFGHERGAFTGAVGMRKGRFEEADGGTLFLDEIGEIAPSTQVKLLRFLQEREFERVGGNRTQSVDVRVVAATNRDLQEEVRSGRFREDLYYRLNVIHIETPPLRTRRGDISVLVHHFIAKYAAQNDKQIKEIAPEAMSILEHHEWPGNVRELENVVERAVVLAESGRIEPRHLPGHLGDSPFAVSAEVRVPGSTLADLERYAILKTYEYTGGNTKRTADMLGISVRKIQYKLKEYRT